MSVSQEQQNLEIAPIIQMLNCATHCIRNEYDVIQNACALEFKLKNCIRSVITFVYSLFNSVFHSSTLCTITCDRIAK